MIYLILAITFSSLFPITFRIGKRLNYNPPTTIVFNYIFGALYGLISFFIFIPDSIKVSEIIISILIGIPASIFYFFGLVIYQKTINQSGLSIAALFMKISLIIPIFLSILFFYERPSLLQTLGIVLAVLSIIILNGGIRQFNRTTPLLLILTLFAGLGDFTNKLFEQFGNLNYRYLFIFFNFSFAAIFGFIKDKKMVIQNTNKLNIYFGFVVGIINALTTYFIVATLSTLSASISLVILNISVIIIVSLVGIVFFKERLRMMELLAYAIAISSIIIILF